MSIASDDIIYMILLAISIGFGHFFQKLKEPNQRKGVGTLLGLIFVIYLYGINIIHLAISFIPCCFIILYTDQRKSHVVCFFFMFIYLGFYRMTHWFGLPMASNHSNMMQMILTLKIVGLSFERNAAYTKSKLPENVGKVQVKGSYEDKILKIDFMDIFHYTFSYVGILTGPYITYRTYHDFIHLPFSQKADYLKATLNKIKWTPLLMALYLIASTLWPLNYATTPEFYDERSIFYRIMYVWPTFFIFRMRIYTGLILSECVCTMAGCGAYPKSVKSRTGSGPSEDYNSLVEKTDDTEYDFTTIQNIDIMGTETCWTFREAMKHWNQCVQFWLAFYVYKRFPNKKLRILATLAVSAYWHGVHPGYYFCILGAPFYLPIEDLFTKLFRENKSGIKLQVANIICWILKFFSFSYMGIAFLLMKIDKIWYYYTSVYHFGYVLWFSMFVAFSSLYKMEKAARRKSDKEITEKTEATKVE